MNESNREPSDTERRLASVSRLWRAYMMLKQVYFLILIALVLWWIASRLWGQ